MANYHYIQPQLDISDILNGAEPNSQQAATDFGRWLVQSKLQLQDGQEELALVTDILKSILSTFKNFVLSKIENIKVEVSISSLRILILEVRHALDRLQDITQFIDSELEGCGGLILKTYRMLNHLTSSIIGHAFYEYLEYTVGFQLMEMIRTMSIPNPTFFMVCRYLTNISWDLEYHEFLTPTWIPGSNQRNSKIILEILRETSESFPVKDFDIKVGGVDLELGSKKIIGLFNEVTLNLYPDECFDICKRAAKATLGNINFLKKMMIQKIVNGLGMCDDIQGQYRSQMIYYVADFRKQVLDQANVEITAKVMEILLGPNSNFEHIFFNLLVFINSSSNSVRYSNFKFIPHGEMRARFLRKIVKHVSRFSTSSHPPKWSPNHSLNNSVLKIANDKFVWSKCLGFFLIQSNLNQNFVECFFEERILKGLIGGLIKLNTVKNMSILNSIEELGSEIFYFKEIVEHSNTSLERYMHQFNSTFTTEFWDNRVHLLILPSSPFSVRCTATKNVPFDLPNSWKAQLGSVSRARNGPRDTRPVEVKDQPQLHRVLLKSSKFKKKSLQINLGLYQAVILDTLFNKKDSWSIDDIQRTLNILDFQSFRTHLSLLVKYGLLKVVSDSIYKINPNFTPNPRLIKNNVLYLP